MKVVVCWAGMQGYVAACLRALNKVPSIEMHVLHLDFKTCHSRKNCCTRSRTSG